MSTTSCPRCSGQVTLPVGVSNSALVRCPLCRAHYTLADALLSMPPLLEVVEEGAEGAPADWFAAPPAEEADHVSETSTVAALALDDVGADAVASDVVASDVVEFAAEEASDEDLALQGSDTEVEELSFSTFDSGTPEAPPKAEPVASLGQDDDDVVFDLDKPPAPAAAGDEEPELEFGEAEAQSEDSQAAIQFGEPRAASDDLDFDADESNQTATGASATIDFDQPQSTAGSPADDDVQFDFDSPAAPDDETVEFAAERGIAFEPDLEGPVSRNEPALGEFGDLEFKPSGEADDIGLDVPDEAAASPVVADIAQQPDTGKKKGKKKKEKAAQASTNGSPQRSLVGRLVRVAVSLLIAVPMAAYVALWISPGLDYFGMGSILPKAMLPAGFNKYKNSQIAENQPAAKMPDFGAVAASANFRPPTETGADDAQKSPSEETPADEPPALGPDLTTPADAPAASPAEPPAEAPADAAEKMPDEDAAAPPADPFAADEAPEKMPPTGAAPAADAPFAKPKAPEAPAAATTKPAADADPFATPALETKPAPDSPPTPADPFAPPEKPAADKPAEPSAPVEALPEPEQPAAPVLGPRNVGAVSGADVMGALQATQAAGQQMLAAETAGDQAQLNKARANFYVTLFNMANAITLGQQGPAGAQLSGQLQAMEPMFRQQFSADPKRLESLKVFGARWFAFPKRTNNGVVLAGTVESIDQVGKLFHAKIKPGQSATSAVTVVCAKDPKLAAGDEVLTLGSIVEKPADELTGYEGSEPAVVWSGMTMKISP